jgi:hypothetical protein
MSRERADPAFPERCDAGVDRPGMTLRDWFAGQALAGMLAAPGNVAEMDCGERARYAYLNADAMLKAREGA